MSDSPAKSTMQRASNSPGHLQSGPGGLPSRASEALRTKLPSQSPQSEPFAFLPGSTGPIKASVLNKVRSAQSTPSSDVGQSAKSGGKQARVSLPPFPKHSEDVNTPSSGKSNDGKFVESSAAKVGVQGSRQKPVETAGPKAIMEAKDDALASAVKALTPTSHYSSSSGSMLGKSGENLLTEGNLPISSGLFASASPPHQAKPKTNGFASNRKVRHLQAAWENRNQHLGAPKNSLAKSPSPAISTASSASKTTTVSSSSDGSIPAILPKKPANIVPAPANNTLKRNISSDSDSALPLGKRRHTESVQADSDLDRNVVSGHTVHRTQADAQERSKALEHDSSSLEQYNRAAFETSNGESSWDTTQFHRAEEDTSDEDPDFHADSKSEETASFITSEEAMEPIPAEPSPQTNYVIPTVPRSENELDLNIQYILTAEGTAIPKLDLALDDRPYNLYAKPNGGTMPGRGALFPALYTLSDSVELPFVCPVRRCQKAFIDLRRLAGHFSAAHNQCVLNDCRDGTFLVLEKYKSASKSAKSPAFVTSRAAMVPAPPPPPPPPAPSTNPFAVLSKVTTDQDKNHTDESRSHPSSITWKPLESTLKSGVERPEALSYINGFLPPDHPFHQRIDIDHMAKMTRKRAVPSAWQDYHKTMIIDCDLYALVLAYLVGDEAPPESTCEHCYTYRTSPTPGKRLSQHCVQVPPDMPGSISLWRDRSCVGCRYTSHVQRQRNRCSRLSAGNGTDTDSTTSIVNGQREPRAKYPAKEAVARDRHTLESNQLSSQQPPIQANATSKTEVPPPQPNAGSLFTKEDMVSIGHEAAAQALPKIDAGHSASAVVQNRGLPPNCTMQTHEMEEWEFSPGIIKDASTDDILMMSSPYLSLGLGQCSQIYPDLFLGVKVICRGQVVEWPAQNNQIKSCFVGTGQLTVHIAGQTARIGPGGAFVLTPGRGCRIENKTYIDAMVMVTEVHDYRLIK